jgi:hypothetical protein
MVRFVKKEKKDVGLLHHVVKGKNAIVHAMENFAEKAARDPMVRNDANRVPQDHRKDVPKGAKEIFADLPWDLRWGLRDRHAMADQVSIVAHRCMTSNI